MKTIKIEMRVYDELTNDYGQFKMAYKSFSHAIGWRPSDRVIVRPTDGAIIWFIDSPKGALIKYPCGTKRFISQSTGIDPIQA